MWTARATPGETARGRLSLSFRPVSTLFGRSCAFLLLLSLSPAEVQFSPVLVAAQNSKQDPAVWDWWYHSNPSERDVNGGPAMEKCRERPAGPDIEYVTDYDIEYKSAGAKVAFCLVLLACLALVFLISKMDERDASEGRVVSRKQLEGDATLRAVEVGPSEGDASHRVASIKERASALKSVRNDCGGYHPASYGTSPTAAGRSSQRREFPSWNAEPADASTIAAHDDDYNFPLGEGEAAPPPAVAGRDDELLSATPSDAMLFDTSLQQTPFSLGLNMGLVSTKQHMREVGGVGVGTDFEDKEHAKLYLKKIKMDDDEVVSRAMSNTSTGQGMTSSDDPEGGDNPVQRSSANQGKNNADGAPAPADGASKDGEVQRETRASSLFAPLAEVGNLYWEFVTRPQKERLYFLDFGRVCCIMCVVTEHAGSNEYAKRNVFGTLNWVLPFLYLISGWCFVMSHAPLVFYLLRLGILFAVGVLANYIADCINEEGAAKFSQDGTFFHMTFVLMLLGMAIVAFPIRRLLMWRAVHPFGTANLKLKLVCGFYFLTSVAGVIMYTGGWLEDTDLEWFKDSNTRQTLGYWLADFFGMLFLVAFACCVGTNRYLPYVLMVYVWGLRVLIPMNNVGFLHLVKLYLYGMVMCKYLPKHNDYWKNVLFRTYWPLSFLFLVFLQIPESYGRCDLFPRQWTLDRLRWYGSEMLIVVWFSSGAMNTADPYRLLPILGNWALFAYAFHEFFNRLIPMPYGSFVVLIIAPLWVVAAKTGLLGGKPKSGRGSARSGSSGAGKGGGGKGAAGKGGKSAAAGDKDGEPAEDIKTLNVKTATALGLVVQDVTGEITAVQPQGWADRNGLRVGDHLRKIEAGGRSKEFLKALPRDMQKDLESTRAMLNYERPLAVTVCLEGRIRRETRAAGASSAVTSTEQVEVEVVGAAGPGTGSTTQARKDPSLVVVTEDGIVTEDGEAVVP